MRIRTKLNASIWVSGLATALIIAYLIVELFYVISAVKESILINDTTKQIVTLHFLTYDYIQRPLERKVDQWRVSHDALNRSLKRIQSSSAGISLLPPNVVTGYQSIRETFDQLVAQTGNPSHRGATAGSDLTPSVQSHLAFLLITKNQELYDWVIQASILSNERVLAIMQRGTSIFLPIMIGLTLSFGGLLYFVSQSLFRSLNRLHLGVEAISHNDLSYRIPVITADELGQLSATFNRMTDELQKLDGSLRESEGRYRAFFEQGPDGVVVLDPDGGRFVEFNDQVCRQLGYTRDEFDQLRLSDVEATETAGDVEAHVQHVMRNGRDDFETVQRTKQGGLRNVHVTAQVIRTAGSAIYHCIWRDVTDRKTAEAERERLQEQLLQAQKMESVGRLAGGVAHDFNNMLGVILGHTEMALDQTAPSDPLRGDLVEIRKATNRSVDLTRQMLAFARKQTVAPSVVDLNENVAGMLSMLQRLIGEDIHLSWQPGSGLWPVRIDPSQVDQIMANLCVNARDAIADVGRVTIETGNAEFDAGDCTGRADLVPGEYVRLAVSDTGSGMDAETLTHVFEPFFTTKSIGRGTGLGLATVYGIVKQNDGFIHVESAPGLGTTFTIFLRRHWGEVTPASTGSGSVALARGHETILLVEDEPAILHMATRMLQGQGYKVLAAGTPSEAIRVAEEHSGDIELLMTDVVMPDMNGRDLAAHVRAVRPGLKLLFMSGYPADAISHRGVIDEGVHFIQKPFTRTGLASKVRATLDSDMV